MSKEKRKPTEEQLEALRAYAAWAGRNWKSQLGVDWMRARSDWPGNYALLQQVRNALGPSWLYTFKLEGK